MYKVVLIRHGRTLWNERKCFTGWVDANLSIRGVREAKRAGKLLNQKGFVFDIAFTSWLKRATRTTDIILKVMKLKNIPVKKTWKLNERHYGALQGKSKPKTARKFGKKQTHIWRRSWATKPPALEKTHKYWAGNNPKYKGVKREDLPLTESLKDTSERVLPYWKQEIVPAIKKGKAVLISGHGSGIRALVKEFDNISDKAVENLNIPTGIPLVYELDKNLKPLKHYYLGNQRRIKRAIKAWKDQSKIKN